MKKKLYSVLGNCQGRGLSEALSENEEFSAQYEFVEIGKIQLLDKKDCQKTLEIVEKVDLLLYQPIGMSAKRPLELTSDYLVSKLKKGAISYSFPSLYFDGYFPHLKTFEGRATNMALVHDLNIAYMYALDFSQKEVHEVILNENLYPPKLSVKLLEESFANLIERESHFNLDIRVSNLIRNYYKTEKLFYQYSHPSRKIIKFISDLVCKKLNIANYTIPKRGSTFNYDKISAPIYRSTYRNLDLDFDTDFDSYNSIAKKKQLNHQEVIENYFNSYEDLDKGVIRDFVRKSKPFIPNIIDNL